MVSVVGVLNSIWGILASISPIGIEPVLFWLTFLLSFGIIFLLLQLLPLFEEKRGIAAIVGLVMAYFVASSSFAVIIISRLFPNVGLALMGILGLLMVVALISPASIKKGEFTMAPVIVIVAFVIVIWLTYSAVSPELAAAGVISESAGTSITNQDVAAVAIILVIIGLLWWVFREPKKKDNKAEQALKWLFGKKW